jgi:hypothetical protein
MASARIAASFIVRMGPPDQMRSAGWAWTALPAKNIAAAAAEWMIRIKPLRLPWLTDARRFRLPAFLTTSVRIVQSPDDVVASMHGNR